MFSWYQHGTAREKKTFWACFSGWCLDALDAQVFTLAIPALLATFGIDRTEAGVISSATLVSSALGGWLAGALSDRFGRVRTLQWTILWFAGFTFLCAFAQSFPQLLVLKALQGVGFGGEWAAGAVLMAESIRPNNRGEALAAVQSAWAIGWGVAVLSFSITFSILTPELAWRVMFALGILPALLVIFIRRGLVEPPRPQATPERPSLWAGFVAIFERKLLRVTLLGAILGTGAHGGYYALMTWLPTFLARERHLSVLHTGEHLAIVIIAFWCGCFASSKLIDRIGRRYTIALFSLCCIVTVYGYVSLPLSNHGILLVGFPLGFFAAGIPATLGALFNELYPSHMRGAGVGFCYNFGRIASAIFPALVGYMSRTMPLGQAIGMDAAAAYGLALLAVLALPETRGVALDTVQEASSS
jgi:MFS family permease